MSVETIIGRDEYEGYDEHDDLVIREEDWI
ncbi:hypothetical protein PHABIO_355 [Pseudomonas phage Phabio]|uniref:Uncharacterized protein n=1 Tax=Pseudomonas phage Phabio TaxID=2006668 RepID=A0A1Y0SZ90_9CAUD|nr:hypothetical protein MZD05_gp355 [Pseudomonas phage Phabio]ARV76986.1 hypothetical protein PHABIO_355 [Pseudomonas phage Phabio]